MFSVAHRRIGALVADARGPLVIVIVPGFNAYNPGAERGVCVFARLGTVVVVLRWRFWRRGLGIKRIFDRYPARYTRQLTQ